MANSAAVYSGTVARTDWATSDVLDVTFTGTPVTDIAHCILQWGGAGQQAGDDSDMIQIMGYILDTDTIRFQYGDGSLGGVGADIEWRVLEFDADQITVQTGETAVTTGNTTLGSAVALDDTILMHMGMFDAASGGYSNSSIGFIELTGVSTITYTSNGTATDAYGWQVVEYDTAEDISCQHGNFTIQSANSVETQAITAVTESQTLLFTSGPDSGGSSMNNDDTYWYADFSASNTIRVTRAVSGGNTSGIGYCVADMSDGASVQTGLMTTFTSETETADFTAITPAQSMVFSTASSNTMSTMREGNAGENGNLANISLTFVDADTVQADAYHVGVSEGLQWQVCEWPVAAASSIIPMAMHHSKFTGGLS